jgi:ABC-type amino acid transport substrate-binding protein
VLGDANAVDFRPLSAQQRFTALQTGEVDLLSRNTTWTLSRDSQNGLEFGPPVFYDGQGLMVRVSEGLSDLIDLDGAPICVGSGTTTEKNLEDAMRSAGVVYQAVVLDSPDEVFSAYDSGRCAGVTADRSALVSRQTTLREPDDHFILDAVLSKEPLAPAVLQGDPQWADIVRWVVFGLFQAEEFGIRSDNLADFEDSANPEIRRFLGVDDALGEGLGIRNDFMIKSVAMPKSMIATSVLTLPLDSPELSIAFGPTAACSTLRHLNDAGCDRDAAVLSATAREFLASTILLCADLVGRECSEADFGGFDLAQSRSGLIRSGGACWLGSCLARARAVRGCAEFKSRIESLACCRPAVARDCGSGISNCRVPC